MCACECWHVRGRGFLFLFFCFCCTGVVLAALFMLVRSLAISNNSSLVGGLFLFLTDSRVSGSRVFPFWIHSRVTAFKMFLTDFGVSGKRTRVRVCMECVRV